MRWEKKQDWAPKIFKTQRIQTQKINTNPKISSTNPENQTQEHKKISTRTGHWGYHDKVRLETPREGAPQTHQKFHFLANFSASNPFLLKPLLPCSGKLKWKPITTMPHTLIKQSSHNINNQTKPKQKKHRSTQPQIKQTQFKKTKPTQTHNVDHDSVAPPVLPNNPWQWHMLWRQITT